MQQRKEMSQKEIDANEIPLVLVRVAVFLVVSSLVAHAAGAYFSCSCSKGLVHQGNVARLNVCVNASQLFPITLLLYEGLLRCIHT
jgi:hypothetical protein